jgi:hypothetical protein
MQADLEHFNREKMLQERGYAVKNQFE